MGERLSDGGPSGRRRAHPDGAASGSRAAAGEAALEALLAAAIRSQHLDAEGEQRAVAAYRASRAAGAHRARTRRRDDWRPRAQRRPSRSLKATLSLFVASLTLGGVAVAAIGTTGSSSDSADGPAAPTPSAGAADQPGGDPSSRTPGAAQTERPDTAQDTEAQCRVYEQVDGRGNALDAAAWQRLVEAAGGAGKVAAYCAEQLAQATPSARPSRTATPVPPVDEATNGTDNAENGSGNADNGQADQGTGNNRN
ncbi:hypothetical protein AB0I00_37275 [Streptomyces sp. NPDC050803]|uniref:hypothetical protein n=1 Tax=unclassified Streptomyces TaxID=2593676 RepID=UPI00344A97DF